MLEKGTELSNIEPKYITEKDEVKGVITTRKDSEKNEYKKINSSDYDLKDSDGKFFAKNDFFSRCNELFKKIDIDKNSFYDRMDSLSTIFKKPSLPEDPESFLK